MTDDLQLSLADIMHTLEGPPAMSELHELRNVLAVFDPNRPVFLIPGYDGEPGEGRVGSLTAAQLLTLLENAPIELLQLPTWDDMSALDKGAACMHWVKEDAGDGNEYPCRYFDSHALVQLSQAQANAHAATMFEIIQRLPYDQYDTLYEKALKADTDRFRREYEAAKYLPTGEPERAKP